MNRCGFVTLVGRPNVGKSTLVNRVLGIKVSITSRRPQTTRNRILGVKTSARGQLILIDTPGLHAGEQRALNRAMNRAALAALDGVDLVAFMCEAMRFDDRDQYVLQRIVASGLPCLLVVNKVDQVKDKEKLFPFLKMISEKADFKDVIPLSARRERDAQRFEEVALNHLPIGEPVFADDLFTDRSARFLAAELIREKLLRHLGDEVPHRSAVEIVAFNDMPERIEIDAAIWVEGQGQKAIVIGKGASMLKAVGTEARLDIGRVLGRRVRLDLWVKVKRGWSNSERWLAELGLHE